MITGMLAEILGADGLIVIAVVVIVLLFGEHAFPSSLAGSAVRRTSSRRAWRRVTRAKQAQRRVTTRRRARFTPADPLLSES